MFSPRRKFNISLHRLRVARVKGNMLLYVGSLCSSSRVLGYGCRSRSHGSGISELPRCRSAFSFFSSSFAPIRYSISAKEISALEHCRNGTGVHIYSVYVSGAVSAIRLRNWQQQDQKVCRLIGAVVTWRFCVAPDLGDVPGGAGLFIPHTNWKSDA